MTTTIAVGDADSIIALLLEYDANHEGATSILHKFNDAGITVLYPNTAIAEAITTVARRHSNPLLAEYLKNQYQKGNFSIEYIGEKIMLKAADLYDPKGSKQNTFFDAIVAAVAKSLSATIIFSFDTWYQKQGLKLA